MYDLNITVNQRNAVLMSSRLVANGINVDRLKVMFSRDWDEFAKTAVFYITKDEIYENIVNDEGYAVIPHEVLVSNETLKIGIYGSNAAGDVVTTDVIRMEIDEGITVGANAESGDWENLYAQVLSQYQFIREQIVRNPFTREYELLISPGQLLRFETPSYREVYIGSEMDRTLHLAGWKDGQQTINDSLDPSDEIDISGTDYITVINLEEYDSEGKLKIIAYRNVYQTIEDAFTDLQATLEADEDRLETVTTESIGLINQAKTAAVLSIDTKQQSAITVIQNTEDDIIENIVMKGSVEIGKLESKTDDELNRLQVKANQIDAELKTKRYTTEVQSQRMSDHVDITLVYPDGTKKVTSVFDGLPGEPGEQGPPGRDAEVDDISAAEITIIWNDIFE